MFIIDTAIESIRQHDIVIFKNITYLENGVWWYDELLLH